MRNAATIKIAGIALLSLPFSDFAPRRADGADFDAILLLYKKADAYANASDKMFSDEISLHGASV